MYEHDIWFTACRLSAAAKLLLIKKYKTAEGVWNNFKQDTILNEVQKNYLKNSWDMDMIVRINKILLQNNINIVCYTDKEYPKKLTELRDAPSLLYYIGNLKMLNSSYGAAIIGSRRCTSYGINASNLIVKELCSYGINIISGLARGIDSSAHFTAIQNGGYTCAVLGCGIDIIYPKENKKLYASIAETGCLISEFIPGTEPYAYNFPIRNRIISALSDVVIIMEASNKSGSLITANLALDQGKDVMALPGSIFSEQSKGCNKLIKDGAYPLTSIEDVLELLNIEFRPCDEKKETVLNKKESSVISLINDNPIHTDDLLKICNIDIKQLYEVLFELQLKNQIMCLAGNYYVRINHKI